MTQESGYEFGDFDYLSPAVDRLLIELREQNGLSESSEPSAVEAVAARLMREGRSISGMGLVLGRSVLVKDIFIDPLLIYNASRAQEDPEGVIAMLRPDPE